MKRVRKFSTFLIFSFATILCSCGDKPEIIETPSTTPIDCIMEWVATDDYHYRVDSKGNRMESDPESHILVDFKGDANHVNTPATCKSPGLTFKVCTVCGKILRYELPELKHDLSEWEIKKQVTPTEKGIKERKCSICDYVETEEFGYLTANYYDGYYSSIVSWENGEDLKNQLHTLIRNNFTGLTYQDNWETNQIAEQCLDNFNLVNVVYSQKDDKKTNTYGGSAGATGWQREHAFCASLMTAYNTTDAVDISNNGTSRATDFHNLFASYGAANGSRGNKNFGNHDAANAIEDSKAVDADTYSDINNFEPNDCDKGKLARAIFYMGVMYNEEEESALTLKYPYGSSSNKSVRITAKYKPLQISEDYVNYSQVTFKDFCKSDAENIQALRSTYLFKYRSDTSSYVSDSPDSTILDNFGKAYADYRYNEGQFAIGNLSTLLDWNKKEVDRQEMWHNETVYSYVHQNNVANKGKKQGNRNPFVDYPELVDYVYGTKKDEPGKLYNLRPSAEDLYSNPKEVSNYALSSYKEQYLVGQTLSSSDYTLVRVNNDFTTQDIDFENTNQDYTFVEGDIGQKTITITTPKGNISYVVNVESASGLYGCNYNFMISKSSFNTSTINKTPVQMLSYGGVTYNVSAGIDNCAIRAKDSHVQIGTGNAPAGTVTIESTNDFVYEGKSNICSVYLGLNTASGTTYRYKISIGGEVVKMDTFQYIATRPGIVGLELLSPLSGKLKIELYEITKAVYISQISVRVN